MGQAGSATLPHLQEAPAVEVQELPPDVSKRCYHRHIWPERLAVMKRRSDAEEEVPDEANG